MCSGKITSFSGPHRWLSNFWPAPVRMSGVVYPTVEHAYQAAKTTDPSLRQQIAAVRSPAEAKRLGRRLPLRPDWEQIKQPVMLACLRAKFRHPELHARLLATGDALLVEGNAWGDRYWGVCRGIGQNHLGRLLMQVRNELRESEAA